MTSLIYLENFINRFDPKMQCPYMGGKARTVFIVPKKISETATQIKLKSIYVKKRVTIEG